MGGSLMWLICVGAMSALVGKAAESAEKYHFEYSFPVAGIRDCPLGMCSLLVIAASWFCGRWSLTNWHHPVAGVARTARIGAAALLVAPLTTLLALQIFMTVDLKGDVTFLVGMFAWVLMACYWLGRIKQAPPVELTASKTRLSPTARDRLLFNAAFLGTILPGLMMATGISQFLSLSFGIVPFLSTLFGNRPSEPLPNVDGSIAFIYVCHFAASFYLAAMWMVAAIVHAGVVLGFNRLFGTAPTETTARTGAGAGVSE
jgi:hypothetical protein